MIRKKKTPKQILYGEIVKVKSKLNSYVKEKELEKKGENNKQILRTIGIQITKLKAEYKELKEKYNKL